jgi:hypothetical protein
MRSLLRLAVLGLLVLGRPPWAGAQVIDRVLAKVDGRVITLSDVQAALALGLVPTGSGPDRIAEALAALVDRELMLGDVNRYAAPMPDAAAVEARLAAMATRFPSEAAWLDALAGVALTPERLRGRVRDDLRIGTYITERFSAPAAPTDDEVARYYDRHRAEFTRDGQLLPLDDVRELARERAAVERRQALVADWIERLRQRADVIILPRRAG